MASHSPWKQVIDSCFVPLLYCVMILTVGVFAWGMTGLHDEASRMWFNIGGALDILGWGVLGIWWIEARGSRKR